jgi:hypothetical protein
MADPTTDDTTDDTSGETICTLPPDELRTRIARLRAELLPQVAHTAPLPNDAGVVFDFVASPALARRLKDLVAFERQCCSGLDWTLERSPTRLRLIVAGVAPDSPFFRRVAGGG